MIKMFFRHRFLVVITMVAMVLVGVACAPKTDVAEASPEASTAMLEEAWYDAIHDARVAFWWMQEEMNQGESILAYMADEEKLLLYGNSDDDFVTTMRQVVDIGYGLSADIDVYDERNSWLWFDAELTPPSDVEQLVAETDYYRLLAREYEATATAIMGMLYARFD